jgi:CRISPR-associated endonuclease/helicase Cas3
MANFGAQHFERWFRELWGQAPFAWQRSLVERVLGREDAPWPQAIALPTGSGKTACLDIAVFTLAVAASHRSRGVPLHLPRRVLFVVDRRIIVDEAFERAKRLARALREARDGLLKVVADELRALAGGDDPLVVHELRGGIYRSADWARSPVQPMILCSTVDQVGSALLFRGYGSSWKTWPITAALVGNDSLILLDEAHCARPFLETVTAVQRYRGWARERVGGPFQLVVMSATPPQLGDVFRDLSGEPRDPTHPLGRRQLARKPVTLRIAESAGESRGRGGRGGRGRRGAGGVGALATELVGAAEELAAGSPKAVVVFCNRVATAREVYRALAERHGTNAILLTGRMRPLDRDDVVRTRLGELASARSEARRLEAPVFVVATQTLEVGADLDFDALVTECASLDALRQRVGRLNRMGRPIDARAVIVIRSDQVEGSEGDPVYGAALAKTWQYLVSLGEPDLGIAALTSRMDGVDALAELNAPAVPAPTMLPSHVDCWAQTAPVPEPTPDVALFLHGANESTLPFVHVCWRGDLDLREGGRSASLDVLAQVPPLAAECLPVPLSVFRAWLAGRAVPVDESPDLEGGVATGVEEELSAASPSGRLAVLWRGRSEARVIGVNEGGTIVDVSEAGGPVTLRPGDTVVVAALGEAASEYRMLGDLPPVDDAVQLDRGDEAFHRVRGRALLRLHPALVRAWPESEGRDRLLGVLADAQARFEEDPDALQEDVLRGLRQLGPGETPSWLSEAIGWVIADPAVRCRPHPVEGVIVEGRRRVVVDESGWGEFSDEDDATASGVARVELVAHLHGVAVQARRFAEQLGLSPELADVMAQAGLLHDLGKADPRFQALLNGGNRWLGDVLLAKSRALPRGLRAFRRAREAAGYPPSGRHELLSVRLAESNEVVLPRDPLQRDLLLHLIASHHGHCRPFAPVVVDERPCEVRVAVDGHGFAHAGATGLERLDSGVADRYWRLVRHYGWWGLAWLEALLRLADHRRSEAEEEVGG